jgi:hypothetical protein
LPRFGDWHRSLHSPAPAGRAPADGARGERGRRDLVDLYLFSSHAAADAPARLHRKLDRLGIDPDAIRRRLDDLGKSTLRHAAAIDAVIQGQIDPASAATLADAGGGRAVLASVRGLLGDLLATSGKRS